MGSEAFLGDLEEYCFPSSDAVHQLAAVDSALPPIYSRRVFIFSDIEAQGLNQSRSEAIRVLCHALHTTVEEFPVLANSVSMSSGTWKFLPGQARLHIRELPMSFEGLKNENFATSLLKADVLASVPGMIDFEQEWDCCRFQATFIQGGLLLSVSINHLAMDGISITRVVRALARNSCIPPKPSQENSVAAFDRSRLSSSSSVPDIAKIPAYIILSEAFDFATRTAGSISTRMYQFTEQTLAQLKSDCSLLLPPKSWISTQNAVCALVFRQIIKARLAAGILKPTDKVQYSFAVEFRNIIEPPLPADFVGNAVLFTATTFIPVCDLVAPEGLSLAAAAVRRAIQEVDAAYVDNFIAVIKSLPDPRALNFYGAVNGKTTAITSTSYKNFVMPSDWHLSLGKYEAMRLLDGGLGDGMFVIMPVRETGWEVIATLASPAMDVFEDKEWNKYARRV
ncbi:O-acetyltransferase pyr7 [Lachnellula suecica]|uniref:O-acetyltransferase pyr7 n=1 Tax=Lachnellula suecica TaxID=602035 RepID=A0A8T9C9R1_9HELO|nr:O-acetyltransferase pyr7 [Lachnellula suecica]